MYMIFSMWFYIKKILHDSFKYFHISFIISSINCWICNQLIMLHNPINPINSMFELEPYNFCDPVPLIECLHGIDDVIIDVVGIHFFDEDNIGLHYWVNWSNNRDVAVWEPTCNLTNIRDGLLLWKINILTILYNHSLEPLYLHPEHQLNVGYVLAMNTRDQCDKTNLPYPSWTDMHVNSYEHCTRKVIQKISPRLTEAATTTLSVGKHLIKIPTAGWLVDSCGALLRVMVCRRLKTGPAHFVLGRTALILGNFLCTIHYS